MNSLLRPIFIMILFVLALSGPIGASAQEGYYPWQGLSCDQLLRQIQALEAEIRQHTKEANQHQAAIAELSKDLESVQAEVKSLAQQQQKALSNNNLDEARNLGYQIEKKEHAQRGIELEIAKNKRMENYHDEFIEETLALIVEFLGEYNRRECRK
ncbi:MAG: hypothetical protein KDD70_09110 [Bdellovibrionales bacterium]|nr:hypothetical protein [Bdellovibrionales bacterium]